MKDRWPPGDKNLEISGSGVPRYMYPKSSHLPDHPRLGRTVSPPSPSTKTATPLKSGVQPKHRTISHSPSVEEPDQRVSEREVRRSSQPHVSSVSDASRPRTSSSECLAHAKSAGAGSKPSYRSPNLPLSNLPPSTHTSRYSRPRDSSSAHPHTATANGSQHKSQELGDGQNLVSLGDGAVGRMREVEEGTLLSMYASSDVSGAPTHLLHVYVHTCTV